MLECGMADGKVVIAIITKQMDLMLFRALLLRSTNVDCDGASSTAMDASIYLFFSIPLSSTEKVWIFGWLHIHKQKG